MTLDELYKVIQDRKKNMPEKSYVAALFSEGKDRIIQKVGEEATEVVIAAKNEDKKRIIEESTDLLFHLLVLLTASDINYSEIEEELEKRKK
jgi:phosphoribosyl-ATP pyrophosphohydrolase